MSDSEVILAILRRQEDAVAKGDVDGVMAPIADGAEMFDLPPPLRYAHDPARVADGLRDWFGTWEGGVTTRLEDPQVIVDGDLAVVFGPSRMRGIKTGAGPLDAWNRRTVVLRRMGGTWRIVHEHGSYPMAMDGSGRAMTELVPE